MKNLIFIVLFCILLAGCSKQAWYAGFVEGQKFQCYQLSGNERQHCLESIITDYDRYERERQESIERKE